MKGYLLRVVKELHALDDVEPVEYPSHRFGHEVVLHVCSARDRSNHEVDDSLEEVADAEVGDGACFHAWDERAAVCKRREADRACKRNGAEESQSRVELKTIVVDAGACAATGAYTHGAREAKAKKTDADGPGDVVVRQRVVAHNTMHRHPSDGADLDDCSQLHLRSRWRA